MSEVATHHVALGALAFLAAVIVLRLAVRHETDRMIGRIIVVGFIAKLLGTFVYFRVLNDVYGTGDVRRYVQNGATIAADIRSGSMPDQATETGTQFMNFIVGVVFSVTGPNEIVGYLVFAVLSFVGMYLFLQAFKLSLPQADHRRYAVLVLLLPTMVFWPSTIGKEPWLVFTLGVAAYGAARALRKRRLSYLFIALGTAGVFAVRPHMAALFVIALAVAFFVRFRDPDVRIGLASGLVGIAIVGSGVSYVLINYADEVSGTEASDEAPGSAVDRFMESTDELLERTQTQTTRGGSEFDSRPVRNPIDFAHALVTVPFRPFPNEAHNVLAQLASLEGVLLLGLVIASVPRMARFGSEFFRRPYLMLASTYAVGFIIAFSNVANFGILTRQRAQLFPFLLVLLCLPIGRMASDEGSEEELAGEPTGQLRSGPLLVVSAERTRTVSEGGQSTELVFDLPPGCIRPPGGAG